MFYTAELFLNLSSDDYPIENANILISNNNFYELYDDLTTNAPIFGVDISSTVPDPNDCPNQVVYQIISEANNYCRIWLIINADTYDLCNNILCSWTMNFINDHCKARWLENEFKDLKTWCVLIDNFNEDNKYVINDINEITITSATYINEISKSLGFSEYIPTELSHIISAWKYGPMDDIHYIYDLLIKAANVREAAEVANDFLRMYINNDNE